MRIKKMYVLEDVQTQWERIYMEALEGEYEVFINLGGEDIKLTRQKLDELKETIYLLRTPSNASRLLSAIKEVRDRTVSIKSVSIEPNFDIDDIEDEYHY